MQRRANRWSRQRRWSPTAVVAVAAALATLAPATAATTATAAKTTDAPGTISTFAGGPGEGQATNVAQHPVALAFAGNTLYVADRDTANGVVGEGQRGIVRATNLLTGYERVITACETQCISADATATSPPAHPSGLAVDAIGNLYIASINLGSIKKVSAAGQVTHVAGRLPGTVSIGPGDGGPATSASLSPRGIAVGPDGALYVADSDWNRIRRIGHDGIITTVVGATYTPNPIEFDGFNGDGLPALDTRLTHPTDVAFAPDGTLHFVDSWNNRVRRVDRLTGLVSTVFGPLAPDGTDLSPRTIAFDALGNVLVTTSWKLWRVTQLGTATHIAGVGQPRTSPEYLRQPELGDGGAATAATFGSLSDVATDGTTTYLADWSRVRRINALGVVDTLAGNGSVTESGDGGPATSARLQEPIELFADGLGAVYSARGNRRIAPGPDATISTVSTNGGFVVGADYQGRAYLWKDWRLFRIEPNGALTHIGGNGSSSSSDPVAEGQPATQSGLSFRTPLAFTPSGDIYLTGQVRVWRIDTNGIITTVAGGGPASAGLGDGGPATAVRLTVQAATVDPAGNVYILDAGNVRIRKVDPLGVITTVGGNGTRASTGDGGPATAASFNFNDSTSHAIAADGAGNVFVTEFYSNRVRKIDAAGIVTTVAGGSQGHADDGGPATAGALNGPAGLAVDPAGNLYVSEIWNNRIRKVAGVASATPASPALAWGWNATGQLGLNSTSPATRATPVPALPNVAGGSAGYYHSLAFRTDGTVWAWGANDGGQLGVGSTRSTRAPVRVPGLTGVTATAAGALHSLALRSDGTVWAWGFNGLGQLGDGTLDTRTTPVRVPGLTNVVAIAAGAFHSLALRSDGTVWTWGWNVLGQLGDGTVADRRSPTRAAGLTGVTSISAGAYHSIAARLDGTAWAWGWNGVGQLGDGTLNDRLVPGRVPTAVPITSVSAGAYHNLARTSAGTVVAWGWNGYGQLGDGTTVDRRIPTLVTGLSGVTSLSAGVVHNLARTGASGTVVAWGWNGLGQLGDATTVDRRTPTPVAGVSAATWISAGALHSLAGRP